jgi:hypothetical protein
MQNARPESLHGPLREALASHLIQAAVSPIFVVGTASSLTQQEFNEPGRRQV